LPAKIYKFYLLLGFARWRALGQSNKVFKFEKPVLEKE
jgi:hypothetical protein